MTLGRRSAAGLPLVLLVATVSLLARSSALRNEGTRKSALRGKPWQGNPPASIASPRLIADTPSAVDLPGAYSRIFAVSDDVSKRAPTPPTRRKLAMARQNTTAGGTDAATEVNGPASELLTLLLADYDKNVAPPTDDGSPVAVEINVALHKILHIDLLESTMDLNVWFRLHWRDSRLAWNDTEWGVTRLFVLNQELRYMDIWYPDVTLWNSAYDVATTLGAQMPIIKPTGDVFWGRNGMIKVACNFKGLESFPFGAVKCLMEFGTWSHGPLTVVVKEAPQGGATMAGNSITDMRGAKAVEWKFHTVKSWIHYYPAYPCCPDESNWPVLLVDVELHRTQTLFALKIVVPQVVLALVGFMTFWLSPECGERLGVAVTIPLALAVYDLLVYSTLPASDDISCIGAIGLLGFLFSVVTLAINGAVIHLFHYREPRWWMGSGTIWAIWLRFRQHQVWASLLEVLDKLETELIKQQLKESQAAKKERQAQLAPRARRMSFMGERKSKSANPEEVSAARKQVNQGPAAGGGGGGGLGDGADQFGAPGDTGSLRRFMDANVGIGRRNSMTGVSGKARRLSGLLLVPQQPPAGRISQSQERVPQGRMSGAGTGGPRRPTLRTPGLVAMAASTLSSAAAARRAALRPPSESGGARAFTAAECDDDGDGAGNGGNGNGDDGAVAAVAAGDPVSAAAADASNAGPSPPPPPSGGKLPRTQYDVYDTGVMACTWSISPLGSRRRSYGHDELSGPTPAVSAAAPEATEAEVVTGSPLPDVLASSPEAIVAGTVAAGALSTGPGEGGLSRRITESSLASLITESAVSARLAAAASGNAPPNGLQTPSPPRPALSMGGRGASNVVDVAEAPPFDALKTPRFRSGCDAVALPLPLPQPPQPRSFRRTEPGNGGAATGGFQRSMTSPMSPRISAAVGLTRGLSHVDDRGFAGFVSGGGGGGVAGAVGDEAVLSAAAATKALDAGGDVDREFTWQPSKASRSSKRSQEEGTLLAPAAAPALLSGGSISAAIAAGATTVGLLSASHPISGYGGSQSAFASVSPHFTAEWAAAAAAVPATAVAAGGATPAPATAAAAAVAASALAAAAAAAAAATSPPPFLASTLSQQQLQLHQLLLPPSSSLAPARSRTIQGHSRSRQPDGDAAAGDGDVDRDVDPDGGAGTPSKCSRQARSLPERSGDSFIDMAIRLSTGQTDVSMFRTATERGPAEATAESITVAAVQLDECVVTAGEMATDCASGGDAGRLEGDDSEQVRRRPRVHGGSVFPAPPPAPPPPAPAPPPPLGVTSPDASVALQPCVRPSGNGGAFPAATDIGFPSMTPSPMLNAGPESDLEAEAARGGGGSSGAVAVPDNHGGPAPREGPLMAPSGLTRASAAPTRGPSRLRWQGAATGMMRPTGDVAAPRAASAAAASQPPTTSPSGRAPALTSVRSWGRDGGGAAAAAAKTSGGALRFNGPTVDVSFQPPTSSPSAHMPPVPSPSESDRDGGLHDGDDSGGNQAGTALSGPGPQSPISSLSQISPPPGVTALSAGAAMSVAAPVRHTSSRRGRTPSESLEQPPRAAQRALASYRDARRLMAADMNGSGPPPAPPQVSGAEDDPGVRRLMHQSSAERVGGGGRLQRHGTGSSAVPSQQLGRLASDELDGAVGTGGTGGYLRYPSGAAYSTAYTEQPPTMFVGDDCDLDPELVPKDPVRRRRAGDADGEAGGGGGGGGYNTDADPVAARAQRLANSEYGAWTASCGEPEPDLDPEPERELTLDAVLHVGSPDQLESYLQLILDNPSRELLAVRERVANAVYVFGMEDLVMRLFPIVGRPDGGQQPHGNSLRRQYSEYGGTSRRGVLRGGRRMATASASGAVPTSGPGYQAGAKADFHHMVGEEYNAKWRLLSAFIDANCRYLMPMAYAVCFLLIIWAKVWANSELQDGPSPEKSAAGVQSSRR